MLEIEEIRRLLADRNLAAVARGAGVHVRPLYRLMRGGVPRYPVLLKVSRYLVEQAKAGASNGEA